MSYQDPQFVPQMLSLAPQRQTTGDGTVVDYKYAFDGGYVSSPGKRQGCGL